MMVYFNRPTSMCNVLSYIAKLQIVRLGLTRSVHPIPRPQGDRHRTQHNASPPNAYACLASRLFVVGSEANAWGFRSEPKHALVVATPAFAWPETRNKTSKDAYCVAHGIASTPVTFNLVYNDDSRKLAHI